MTAGKLSSGERQTEPGAPPPLKECWMLVCRMALEQVFLSSSHNSARAIRSHSVEAGWHVLFKETSAA